MEGIADGEEGQVKERPIRLLGHEVRAILEGRKTQTRRALKPDGKYRLDLVAPPDGGPARCPFGQPGDRLWVRETWAARSDCEPGTDRAKRYMMYRASGGDPSDPMNWHDFGGRWRPSIHMPRWASRLTLEITAVRVEQLQDISEEDAEDEGCCIPLVGHDDNFARGCFREKWIEIYGHESWVANPWVWVVEFRKVEDKR